MPPNRPAIPYQEQQILNSIFTGAGLRVSTTSNGTASLTTGGILDNKYSDQEIFNAAFDSVNNNLKLV